MIEISFSIKIYIKTSWITLRNSELSRIELPISGKLHILTLTFVVSHNTFQNFQARFDGLIKLYFLINDVDKLNICTFQPVGKP